MRDDRATDLQEDRRRGPFGGPYQRFGRLFVVHVVGPNRIATAAGVFDHGPGVRLLHLGVSRVGQPACTAAVFCEREGLDAFREGTAKRVMYDRYPSISVCLRASDQ